MFNHSIKGGPMDKPPYIRPTKVYQSLGAPTGAATIMFLLWLFMCGLFGYGCSSAAKDLGIHWSIGLIIAAIVPFVLAKYFI